MTTPRAGGKAKHDGPVCPKCGQQKGWTGPVYKPARAHEVLVPSKPDRFVRVTTNEDECLLYTCSHCGFSRHEPCINHE